MHDPMTADHATTSGPAESVRRRAGTLAAAAVVLAVAVSALHRAEPEPLPDFGGIERADELKSAFFQFLAPIVEAENARVLAQRDRLLELAAEVRDDRPLPVRERRWMGRLAAEYGLEWPGEQRSATVEALLRRVDVVPPSLALVQAAAESGWGRSRFAREGNNLFGQWCYVPGCGIVPDRRNQGAGHEVAAFDSVSHSVRRYINNLNSHPSYRPLRSIRADMRRRGEPPSALPLADGLIRYSERREDYVDEIKRIIRANRELIGQVIGETSAASALAGEA